MKVKFKYGLRSYSGTLDDLVYANYADRDVVIGRMLPSGFEVTPHHEDMGKKLVKISEFYEHISPEYKSDLKMYFKRLYKNPKYKGTIVPGPYNGFVKLLWALHKDESSNINIDDLSLDDLQIGAYDMINTVQTAVMNGYLPKVRKYGDLTNPITV